MPHLGHTLVTEVVMGTDNPAADVTGASMTDDVVTTGIVVAVDSGASVTVVVGTVVAVDVGLPARVCMWTHS